MNTLHHGYVDIDMVDMHVDIVYENFYKYKLYMLQRSQRLNYIQYMIQKKGASCDDDAFLRTHYIRTHIYLIRRKKFLCDVDIHEG